MTGNHLTRAWLVLITLSAVSALLTTGMFAANTRAVGLVLLALACAKAHIILADYLDLRVTSAGLRSFTVVILIYAAALAGLFLLG